jgi:hypothetical protein
MIRTKAALICWCIAFPAYLLTAGQLSAHELVTGAVLATGAALFADLLATTSPLRFNLPGGSLRPMLMALAGLPRASARTAVAHWHVAVAGRSSANTAAAAFDHGARDDPSERMRRAVALLLASLSPDRFVIRMEADGTFLHNIAPADHAADPRWLT